MSHRNIQWLYLPLQLWYVTYQLGHKDPNVTMKYYIHYLPPADGSRAVDRLDTISVAEEQEFSEAVSATPGSSDRTPAGPRVAATDQREFVSLSKSVVSREGIVHVGEAEGRSRVAEADPDQPSRAKRELVSREGIEPSTRRLRDAEAARPDDPTE